MAKFDRLEKIIGLDKLNILENKTVLVLGCGGVGGYTIEALARSNIGTLIIADFDFIDETNINRQVIALSSTIGKRKVDAFEERIKDINSNCRVVKVVEFINQENIQMLFSEQIDFLVDACDTVSTKKEVIKQCLERGIPFISSMGTGNKLDPSKLEITDIMKTNNDPLARIMRKFVKDEKLKGKIKVLSSMELPVKTGDRTPGSCAFVPSVGGLMIAGYVVNSFINENK